MQTLKIIKAHLSYKTGEIIEVENNEAHSLIDGGYARLFRENRELDYKSPKKTKRYKVK